MARRLHAPVARLRWLLLLVLGLAVATLVLLFLFGRAGRQGVETTAAADDEVSAPGEDITLIGDDFDYTYTEENRPLFRIRGASIRADRAETLYLDQVALTLYDEEGRAYDVASREASFSRLSNEGRLRGDVVLKGPEDLELRTSVLLLRDRGKLLVSPQPVEILYGGEFAAHGQRLRVHLPQELFLLQGEVVVESLPGSDTPLKFSSERIIYERERRMLKAEGGAVLDRGSDHLEARRINAFLAEDERSLVFLRARWDVAGTLRTAAQDGEVSRVRFSGDDLALLMQPGSSEARQVELEGRSSRQPALIESRGQGGVMRRLSARRIEGVLTNGVLAAAQAKNGVELRETAPGRPVRTARGARANARFGADGQLDGLTMEDDVRYTDGQVEVTGERGLLDLEQGRGEFFGQPVVAGSDRGSLTAPHLVYTRHDELLYADQGVRARIENVEESGLEGTPLGDGEGPVWVEAREAFWQTPRQTFLFRGDVRAWRGDNVLLAAELRGEQQQERLTATGGVKTLWIPSAEPAGGKADPGEAAPSQPIEVNAREMVYLEGKGVLTYSGEVRVEQQGRTLLCQELQVELGEDRRAETMTCTGQARLNDSQTGRRAEGDRAVYHLGERRIEMSGSPVVLRERDQNRLEGRLLIYDVEDGRVEMRGAGQAPTGEVGAGARPPATGRED